MDKMRWKTEYPQMPESFRLAVEETVAKCMQNPEKTKEIPKNSPRVPKKRHSAGKWLLLGAAAALLVGAFSVGADKKLDFQKYLCLNETLVSEEIFQKEIKVEAAAEAVYPEGMSEEIRACMKPLKTGEPLLDIREIMYDGLRLAVYAESSQAGREFQMETLRMEIGGEEISPVNTENPGGKENVYVFTADVSGRNLQAPFEVRQEVRVYKDGTRYENQELFYTVDTEGKVEELPDQAFAFEDFCVKVREIRKSPIAVQGLVEVEMTDEQKSRYEAAGKKILADVRLQGKNGEVWKALNFSGEESEETSLVLETFRRRFYVQLPQADEERVILRLQEVLEKQDDWRGVAAQQFEEQTFLGEPMEIPLTVS